MSSDSYTVQSYYTYSGGPLNTTYFNVYKLKYNGTTPTTFTYFFREYYAGAYSHPDYTSPPAVGTMTLNPGDIHTINTTTSTYQGEALVIFGFECSTPVNAPYVYYTNFYTGNGTAVGSAQACSTGAGVYEIYCNVSTLSAITVGTIFYQDKYGQYPYYVAGVGSDRWLAVGTTYNGPVTKAFEISHTTTAVIAVSNC
jgi:hypothetical protein